MSFDTAFQSALGSDSQKRPAEFTIVRHNKKARVTAANQPTIMSMKGKFNIEPSTLVAQQHFFNRQNQEKEYKHVSPWNYPFVQNLLQKKPITNFDMNSFDKIDRYRDSIEGVT